MLIIDNHDSWIDFLLSFLHLLCIFWTSTPTVDLVVCLFSKAHHYSHWVRPRHWFLPSSFESIWEDLAYSSYGGSFIEMMNLTWQKANSLFLKIRSFIHSIIVVAITIVLPYDYLICQLFFCAYSRKYTFLWLHYSIRYAFSVIIAYAIVLMLLQ